MFILLSARMALIIPGIRGIWKSVLKCTTVAKGLNIPGIGDQLSWCGVKNMGTLNQRLNLRRELRH